MAIKSKIGIIGKGSNVVVDYTGLQAAIYNSAMQAPVINDQAVKKHAREWVAGVVATTPVKTGRARAGWYKAVVGLRMSWTDKGTNKDGMMEQGKSEGKFVDRTVNKYKKYVIIENFVPYINALDTGTSKQSPAGMTRIATIGMQAKLGKTLVKGYKQAWVKRRTAQKRGSIR